MGDLITTDWADVPVTAEHAELLRKAAILPEVAQRGGVRSVTKADELPDGCPADWARHLPGIVFWYRSPGGRAVPQLRPDNVGEGDPKYRFPRDAPTVLNLLRDKHDGGPAAIVEGTKQALAAASYAPPEFAVYGMSGVWNGVQDDLSFTVGRSDVVVVLDGDVTSNRDVHSAAERMKEVLEAYGVAARFVRVPSGSKDGLDDFLARTGEQTRPMLMANLLKKASPNLGKKPGKAVSHPFFGEGGLLVQKLAKAIFDEHPSALTAENKVALYRGGVYSLDGSAFRGAVTALLGDMFRPAHRAAVEEFTAGTLFNTNRTMPIYAREPMLNCGNGMLDLRTGELHPWDPKYLSGMQIPVRYDPEAQCPTYERWLKEVIPDQADDLEEVVSQMLDPSRTPSKALLAYGPSRSGKSTLLRLAEAVAGPTNIAGVTLHQLSDSRFAAANVFGKILNVAADLSADHVEDISLFKMLTGADLIQADRKYGGQFAFVNRALFAFSCNTLPTVGEASRAYAERIKPFRFDRSFAGRENPALEEAMLQELPGIFARWVAAHRRYRERGHFVETDAVVRRQFETGSDRVRQFLDEACVILSAVPGSFEPVREGQELPGSWVASATDLTKAFADWSATQQTKPMGRNKLSARLTSIDGVVEVRASGRRGFNIKVRPNLEWGDSPAESGESPAVSAVSNHPAYARQSFEVSDEVRETEKEYLGQGAPKLPKVPEPPAVKIVASADPFEGAQLPPARPAGLRWAQQGLDHTPVGRLLHLLSPLPPIECEECGTKERATGAGGFILACPVCHPATLLRSRPEVNRHGALLDGLLEAGEISQAQRDEAVTRMWAQFETACG